MEEFELARKFGDCVGPGGSVAAGWATLKQSRPYGLLRSLKAGFGRMLYEDGEVETDGKVGREELGLGPDSIGYEPSAWRWLPRVLRKRRIGPDDVFVDLGSGKGRVVLAAARYPFGRVIGVEIAPSLTAVARANVGAARDRLECGSIELLEADLTEWEFPPDVNYVYLFNPVEGESFDRVLANLIASLEQRPRRLTMIYANPTMAAKVDATGRFRLADVVKNPLRPDIGPSGWANVYESL